MTEISCPIGFDSGATVQLGHGSGGVMMHRLLEKTVFPAIYGQNLRHQHDCALLNFAEKRLAFTTDSYVVRPRLFPGGDIGTLAVTGTVNDLAMAGARPLWMSAGFILEEGLPIRELEEVLASMKKTADASGVEIVTGDTKVVDRGHGDGLYLNTAGIGEMEHDLAIGPQAIKPGDVILLSGDLGRHGICILAAREGLGFETTIETDATPLHAPVLALIKAGVPVHCLRDLTRGGLASALKELTLASGLSAEIRERDIPVSSEVRGACELLGLDPLYVANEGRFVAILPEGDSGRALEMLSRFPQSANSVSIGSIGAGPAGQVVLQSLVGPRRVVEMLPGEQLPRIC